METLTLIDGTVLDGHILPSGDGEKIFAYLTGKTLAEGFAIFSNAANISTIIENSHGNEHIYEGYTEILSISSEYGNCNLVLRRGTNA